ncbi:MULTISPECIES: SGNH/GDSL hydrolase family protein [Sporosarcina]|uniref:SGNH/GDSL hydrolase family protein n=1 Tax=Sporosarcina TaxID=1569 RepID=UPI0006939991|nr:MULTISPECIES: SGNH/GDSL hydrolase family protein [Sporosarcina]WJY28233.1 SGNH/GDSL hydrolase family protein [Sporosarcina sp. 0.2-SM1T-5]
MFRNNAEPFTERRDVEFTEWDIPTDFLPKSLHVVGLGDSLTQGVGDEMKRGGYFERVASDLTEWEGITYVETENLAKRGRRSDQLLKQLDEKAIQDSVGDADVIFMTIGGNDLMKVLKANLFKLKKKPFYTELDGYSKRLDEIFGTIRALNPDAPIIMSGLYNPMLLITDEVKEFEDIIEDWNEAIQARIELDGNSCFIPVADLFEENANLVYHTDFFHPNATGYALMEDRYVSVLHDWGLQVRVQGEKDR